MRKVLLSLMILFIGSSAIGQNYQCLQGSVKHFFVNGNNYLRGIRIDSIRTYPDSTIFFPFHTPRGRYSALSLPVLDPNGGSWLGGKVIQLSDGTTIFDNYGKDSVIIRTQADVGETWRFYDDSSSLYYVATVIGKDTMTVLSALDSIKQIRINAFDSSGALPADPLNNLMLILSKDHGFVLIFDLYTFPYHKPDSIYTSGFDYFLDMSFKNSTHYIPSIDFSSANIEFKLVDFINPNDWEMHPWNIGDRFNSKNYCSAGCENYFTGEVASKTVAGHITTYSVSGITPADCSILCYTGEHLGDSGTYSFNDTHYSILNPSGMPEEDEYGDLIYYFPHDSSYCSKAPLYIKKPFPGFGPYITLYTYKAGIGLVNYYLSDGDRIVEASLKYYSINASSCGVPLSINETADQVYSSRIVPNPATTSLIVKTAQRNNTIIIKNPIGQTIKSVLTNESETNVNVSDIPAGIYFITVTDTNGNSSTIRELIVH